MQWISNALNVFICWLATNTRVQCTADSVNGGVAMGLLWQQGSSITQVELSWMCVYQQQQQDWNILLKQPANGEAK